MQKVAVDDEVEWGYHIRVMYKLKHLIYNSTLVRRAHASQYNKNVKGFDETVVSNYLRVVRSRILANFSAE